MKITCPTCQQPIDPEQINVATDVAFCLHCKEAFSLSKQVVTGKVEDRELGQPPKGCWFRDDVGAWEAGSTMRSYAAAFLVPFVCVWSGGSLGGIYGSQLIKGHFDPSLSLFGIPFLLGTMIFGTFAVMSVWGKAVLSVRDDRATLFVGLGPIGRRRRFPWSQITRVSEAVRSTGDGSASKSIRLEGTKKPIEFGSMLSEERRAFLLRLLRRLLVDTTDSTTTEIRNPAR